RSSFTFHPFLQLLAQGSSGTPPCESLSRTKDARGIIGPMSVVNEVLGRLRRYGWTGFRADLVAGLTVAAVAVPQAMAYALIAGADPRHGLYTAIVMTALGSLFGSSTWLINGPTNAISLVVFSGIAALKLTHHDDILRAIFLLSLMVAGLQILIAWLRL